jgi:hypothetical protein
MLMSLVDVQSPIIPIYIPKAADHIFSQLSLDTSYLVQCFRLNEAEPRSPSIFSHPSSLTSLFYQQQSRLFDSTAPHTLSSVNILELRELVRLLIEIFHRILTWYRDHVVSYQQQILLEHAAIKDCLINSTQTQPQLRPLRPGIKHNGNSGDPDEPRVVPIHAHSHLSESSNDNEPSTPRSKLSRFLGGLFNKDQKNKPVDSLSEAQIRPKLAHLVAPFAEHKIIHHHRTQSMMVMTTINSAKPSLLMTQLVSIIYHSPLIPTPPVPMYQCSIIYY